jgi:hypothetical protein
MREQPLELLATKAKCGKVDRAYLGLVERRIEGVRKEKG